MKPTAIYAARRYFEAIRNKGKREYAVEYFRFMRGAALEPDRAKYGINYMAAQAVRIDLGKIAQDLAP